jgi:hypothetical protein
LRFTTLNVRINHSHTKRRLNSTRRSRKGARNPVIHDIHRRDCYDDL